MRLWKSHKQIRILKGWHKPLNIPSLFSKNWVAGEIRKSELSKYYLEGEDKYDWNKEYGIGTPSIKCWMYNDCLMIGGRFIPEKDAWEYTYYVHTTCDEKPVYGEPLFTATVFDKPRFQLEVAKDKLRFWLQKSPDDEVHYFEFPRTSKSKWTRRIKGWQGGTSPAPNNIQYYIVESKKRLWQ